MAIFAAVSRFTWWAIGIGIAYLVFYLGGNYSFRYTHVCAHSHRVTTYEATSSTPIVRTISVCDRYTGNAKTWSFGDPVRAIGAERLTKWNGFIVGGIVIVLVAIEAVTFYERRRRKRRPPGLD